MLAAEPNVGDIGALMETVQAEAVDEDLFSEVSFAGRPGITR
jgi:hypothetical protein